MLGFITTQGEHYAAQGQKIRDLRAKIHEMRFKEKASLFLFRTEIDVLKCQRGFISFNDSLLMAARAVSEAISLRNEILSIRMIKKVQPESAAVPVPSLDNNILRPNINPNGR